MSRAFRLVSLWLPVLVYGAAVFYLSSLQRAPVAGRVPDYILHPVEYLGLTLLVVRAMNGGFRAPLRGSICLGAIALAVAYAISDEYHQLHVPRRTASVKDVLSDTLGAVLAIGVAEGLQRARGRRGSQALRITLVTRAGCAPCHRAKEILGRIAEEIPLEVSEVDVDSDPAWAAYGDQVPVILANGTKISKLAPDEEAIRRRLLRKAPPARE